MPDMEYIEQNAYNQGYRRGYEAGRKAAVAEFDERLSEQLAELKTALRRLGADSAKCLRDALNDVIKERNDGDD